MKFQVFYTAYHYLILNEMFRDYCYHRQALRYVVWSNRLTFNSVTYLKTNNTGLIKYEVSKSH